MSHFTKKQLQYQAWLSVPRQDRLPATKGDFAKSIGVTERTLTRWHDIDGWWQEVNSLAVGVLRSNVSAIIASVGSQAMLGSFKHQRLALQLVGLLDRHGNLPGDLQEVTQIRLTWRDKQADDNKG